MKTTSYLWQTVSLLMFLAAGQGHAITFQPDPAQGKDAMVYAFFPTRNYGELDYFGTMEMPPPWPYGDHTVRSFLDFDIEQILADYPAGQIKTATLGTWFYNVMSDQGFEGYDPDPNEGAIVNAYSLQAEWDESLIVFDEDPPSPWQPQPQPAQLISTVTVTGDENGDGKLDYQWVLLDITDYVRDVLDGKTTDHGIGLYAGQDNIALFMRTSDYSDQSLRPKLTVLLAGDVDDNGAVDGLDLTAILSAWMSTPDEPNWNPEADLDGNSIIDGLDLTEVLTYFQSGETQVPEPTAAAVLPAAAALLTLRKGGIQTRGKATTVESTD